MKNLMLLSCCLITNFLCSQIPVDTSYTIHSTYKKELKKYPNIKIIKPIEDKNITQELNLEYKNTNGRKLYLDAFYNKSQKLQPAVVIIHGGGWKSGNKSDMTDFAKKITSNGYACFNIEFRLSLEAKYPAAIFDVKDAIEYVKTNASKFNVDATKIAVLGCSSGGQMSSLIGTTNGNSNFEENDSNSKTNSDVQAIIDIDGILAFKHPESQEGKIAAEWLGGTYEEKPLVWQQASPLTHVNSKTPPILFINSQFPRFHAGRDDMIAILNQNGIYSEVQNIQNSPHSFWFFDPWIEETIEYTTHFLNKLFKQ